MTFGLAFGAIAWSRTMIGLVVAAARGLLPLRLWSFLDWASEARLLRVSGATYQFRHRELQDLRCPPTVTGELKVTAQRGARNGRTLGTRPALASCGRKSFALVGRVRGTWCPC